MRNGCGTAIFATKLLAHGRLQTRSCHCTEYWAAEYFIYSDFHPPSHLTTDSDLSLFNPYALIAQEHSNMIDDDSKYFSLSGDIPVGGPSTWHITDWDQRRVVSVTMDGEQDDESIAIQHFSRYSSQLSPDVYRIHISHTGEIISTYTDSKNDQAYCVHYPFLHEVFLPEGILTVRRDELEELERLGPDVDLVTYPLCQERSAKKVKSRC